MQRRSSQKAQHKHSTIYPRIIQAPMLGFVNMCLTGRKASKVAEATLGSQGRVPSLRIILLEELACDKPNVIIDVY